MRLLNIQGLGIRLVGYHIGDQYSNAANWLKGLGLPADTPVHWVNAPNKNNSASMLHCGMEVIQQDRKERGSGFQIRGCLHQRVILGLYSIDTFVNAIMVARKNGPIVSLHKTSFIRECPGEGHQRRGRVRDLYQEQPRVHSKLWRAMATGLKDQHGVR